MDSYLLSCGRYIERNPLAAGLVAKPWDYRWSSCRLYALGEPDALVSESPCWLDLATTVEHRQQLWQAFLLDVPRKRKWSGWKATSAMNAFAAVSEKRKVVLCVIVAAGRRLRSWENEAQVDGAIMVA